MKGTTPTGSKDTVDSLDGLFDFSLYPFAVVKRKVRRYKIC
jgi:hypothetical protein